MKKVNSLISIVVFLAMFSACKNNKHEVVPDSGQNRMAYSMESSHCHVVDTFYAGKNIPAGTITINNDSEYLYVTFSTENGWVMGQTHLFVGAIENLPVNKKGNPKIGNFPYQYNDSLLVGTYTYSIPLSEIQQVEANCIIIAAHAEVFLRDSSGAVIDSQSAWGGSQPILDGGSWATYIDYCLCEDPGTEG